MYAEIGQIRYHEKREHTLPSWKKTIRFGLKSTNKSPDCIKFSGEYAIAIPDGNEAAVSMVLSAKMSRSKVLITLDDSLKFSGSPYCLLQHITII